AIERLVFPATQQLGEAVRLPRLVEQVAPEDPDHALGLHPRGQHQEDEAALGAVPAPPRAAARWIAAEDRVAAGEGLVVAVELREGARDRELGPWAQEREPLEAGRALREGGAEQTLELEPLAPLVVDLESAPDQVRLRGRALVGHRHRV